MLRLITIRRRCVHSRRKKYDKFHKIRKCSNQFVLGIVERKKSRESTTGVIPMHDRLRDRASARENCVSSARRVVRPSGIAPCLRLAEYHIFHISTFFFLFFSLAKQTTKPIFDTILEATGSGEVGRSRG